MGKVKDWLIEMQEDAVCMTREEWTDKHGESVIEIYDKIHRELDMVGQQLDFFTSIK